MGSSRKDVKKIKKNLTDELAQQLSNIECFPNVKIVLSDKPHFSAHKLVEVNDACRELSNYLNDFILNYTKEFNTEKHKLNESLVLAITSFLECSLELREYNESNAIFNAVNLLATVLLLDTEHSVVQAEVISLCERYLEVLTLPDDVTAIVEASLKYLLAASLREEIKTEKHSKKSYIRRIWSIRKHVNMKIIVSEKIFPFILAATKHVNYLKCKDGQHLLGYFMSRGTVLVKKMHSIVLRRLPIETKSIAMGYGTVYFNAWLNSEDETQKEVEVSIQDIMSKVLDIARNGTEMIKSGANGLALLSVLHSQRRTKNFSHVLDDLYGPILWRKLKSCNPWERCNAAQVFFDVFPLEKPLSTASENAEYMERQINEILSLLKDSSHFVRASAVKGFCSTLSASAVIFSVPQFKLIYSTIFDELSTDGSSYLVRKTVLEGLEFLIRGNGPDFPTIPFCEPILARLGNLFHDENEKVRKAYVKVLLMVKEKSKEMGTQYWQLQSIENIIKRISVEGPQVGQLLSILVKDHIYSKRHTLEKVIDRFIKLMKMSFQGLKKFFLYCKKAYSPSDAYMIVISIIGFIRKILTHYLQKQKAENSLAESSSAVHVKNASGRRGALEDISNSQIENNADINCSAASLDKPTPSKEGANALLDDNRCISGLIHIASIVYTLFGSEINANDEWRKKLYDLSCAAIPPFLKYYKGTPVYFAVVTYASNIPIVKLRAVSTISSACISELKQISDFSNDKEIECLVYALCSWNRGHDVLELAGEWLNFAFREEQLNDTALDNENQRVGRVRFEQTVGKPHLALKLLDTMFSDSVNEHRILNKHQELLFDFYSCIERIKIVLERRLNDPSRFIQQNQILTDEFIYRAFSQYLHLTSILHGVKITNVPDEETAFDSASVLIKTMFWANSVLLPEISRQSKNEEDINEEDKPECTLVVKCCLALLNESKNAVDLDNTNYEHTIAFCVFMGDLLTNDYNAASWFLESAISAVNTITAYACDKTPNDEWHLLKSALPSVLEKACAAMVASEMTEITAKAVLKDVNQFRVDLFELPTILLRKYGQNNTYFLETFRNIIQACVMMVQQEIQYEDDIILHKKLNEHTYLASVILRYPMVKNKFSQLLVPAIKYVIDSFSKDGYKLLACLSILYTLAYCKAHIPKIHFEDTLQCLYSTIQNYTPNQKSIDKRDKDNGFDDHSSSESWDSVNMDVKKVAEPVLTELADFLNFSLSAISFFPLIKTPLAEKGSINKKKVSRNFKESISAVENENRNDTLSTPAVENKNNNAPFSTPSVRSDNSRVTVTTPSFENESISVRLSILSIENKNSNVQTFTPPAEYESRDDQPSTSAIKNKSISIEEPTPVIKKKKSKSVRKTCSDTGT